MGKITKRTLALILTLCMVMSYMIPAVWAEEEEQDTGVLTYDFGGGEGVHLKAAEIVTQNGFILGGDSELTERSRYVTTSRAGAGGYWTAGGFALKFSNADGKLDTDKKQWFTIQISGVKEGTYDMGFNIAKSNSGGTSKVYVLDLNQADFLAKIPEASRTKINQAKSLSKTENEAIYTAIADYVLNPDNTVVFDSYNHASVAETQSLGNVTFPKDGSYVLMIQSMGPSDYCDDTTCWASFAGLTMTPVFASVTVNNTTTNCTTAAEAVSAIRSAAAGTTVKLYRDITGSGSIKINSGVTLDLNGKTLTAETVFVIGNGQLALNGGTLNAALYQLTAEEEAAAEAVQAQINAIGTVTLESEAAINAADAAYNALTDTQKLLVDSTALDTAKQALEVLIANRDALESVQAKIDAIGTVTLESEAKINEAAAAYQALTDAQKALIDDSALIAAQKQLAALKYADSDVIVEESDEGYTSIVQSAIAKEDAIYSVNPLCAATDTVTINGVAHDYMYVFFNGQIMMVFDLDDLNENGQPTLVDRQTNAFGEPRGIYIDEDHIVWACGAGRMLYKYNPFTQVGERIGLSNSNELFPDISSFNSHGITGIPGTDWLYFGTYNRTFLAAYNKETGELVRLGDVLTNGSGVEDGLRAGFGGVVIKGRYAYLGVDGDANADGVVSHEIIKFDLDSKQIVHRLDIAGDYKMGSANWLENFKLVGENVILGSIWRERSMTFAIDISGEEMKLIEIENLERNFNGGVSGERNGKVYFMGVDGRGLLEYDIAGKSVTDLGIALGTPTGQYLGSLLCTAGTGGWVTIAGNADLPGESLVTFTHNADTGKADLVFYNLTTKKTVTMADFTDGLGSGNQLKALALDSEKDTIYVGAYGNNQLGFYEVGREYGDLEALDQIPTYSHQIDGIIEYGDYVYAGVYTNCSIVQIDLENNTKRELCWLTTDTVFYQNRIHANTAGGGKVFFSTVAAKSWYGGDLIWYDVALDRMYVAAGPNPEDVYYFEAGTKYEWHSALTGEPVVFDSNGDGTEDKDDRFITVDGKQVPRFTGVIENQTIVSMTYRDGYIYGCTTKHNGSGTSVDDYSGNAVLFVYDVAAMKVVATYDLSLGIPGLTEPITAIDLVFEDPDVPGKFWGVVSDTLFSFTFDHTTELFHVTMELSLGRSEYEGVNWRGREILFDGDFMYVPFGTKGLYMIEKDDPTNYYRLTTVVPNVMLLAEDQNIYYIDGDQDLKVLYTAQVTANIKAADAVRAQIAAIGTVTLESETAITAARSAYNALTAEQKAFVKNLDVLTAAEAALAQAQAGAKSVAGTAMTLGNSLSMDFVVAAADAEDGYYAEISRGQKTLTIPKNVWKNYDEDGNYLYFSYTGMAAKEMCEEVTVQIFDSEDKQVFKTWTDSIRAYAMRMLDRADVLANTELRTLYVDMLNYGAAAQEYWDYNENDLANAKLTDTQKAYATTSVTTQNNQATGNGYVGAALTLENQILLDFGFDFADYTGLTAVATYTDHYGNKKTVEFSQSDFKTFTGGRYLSVSGLAVADWKQVVTCTVYNGQQEVVTVSDSMESYVRRQTDKQSLTALVEAIAKFGQAAFAYFH